MSEEGKIRVAVVGGGCASIATAFELTRPEHQGRYEVTLYQLGWRLGGKGASGRGPADRIEEHGLHLWLGFYENAFRLMRECYRELDRDPESCPIAHWRDAFFADSYVGLADRGAGGDWKPWLAFFPPGHGAPGDPLDESNPFTVQGYLARSASLVRTVLRSVRERTEGGGAEGDGEASSERVWSAVPSPREAQEIVGRLFQYGRLAGLSGLIEATGLLASVLDALPGFPSAIAQRLVDTIAASARRELESLLGADDELRRLWEVADLLLATIAGTLRYGLLTDPRGFDAVNDYDFREWLRLNGASPASLDSAFLRGLYDLTFSYEGGDFSRPRMAAGQALRGTFRMFFTYRGAVFWKMRAGMGDVVFAPFYEVLARRGVKFEFFHRLENVRIASEEKLEPGERPYVEALEFDLQARTKRNKPYQPLVDVRGLPCWPSEPDWKQLTNGAKMEREGWRFESHWDRRKVGTRELRVGRDFDCVVLGIGIGAVPYVCKELLERDPRWRAMVDNVQTIATQAFQIWMKEDMSELGWRDRSVNLSAYVKPFDTWADMSHLAGAESWPEAPRSIAYFCSAMPDTEERPDPADSGYPVEQDERVRRDAVEYLNRHVEKLWPRAARSPGRFRWDLLLEPRPGGAKGRSGEKRFSSQYWRANVNPSERYVLSLPGTIRYRISPLDNSYDNLTIAGDWTECGHNAGCVEAAVISGRLAAHALTGAPALDQIIGYDHP